MSLWLSQKPSRLPGASPQFVMMTKDESPKTTWDMPKAAAALGDSVVVVVVVVDVVVAMVAGGKVVSVVCGAMDSIVVSVGAGAGGSVVWASGVHDARINRTIGAARRMAAAYTAG